MDETNKTFKKAPRRKAEKGRRVTLSPEARQAYTDLIQAREEKQESYGRHLPQDATKGR